MNEQEREYFRNHGELKCELCGCIRQWLTIKECMQVCMICVEYAFVEAK